MGLRSENHGPSWVQPAGHRNDDGAGCRPWSCSLWLLLLTSTTHRMLPYGSGTQELKHIRIARSSSASDVSWKHVAVGATVAVATLGYAATMHSMVSNQAAALDALHAQMLAMSSVKSPKHAAPVPAIETLPHKYAVENVTPRKTQDLRGTCWDFATISVLEYSYRQQGIARGWLAPDEYVSLSEQAYGADLLQLCTTKDKSKCYLTATQNTTEGGFIEEFALVSNDVAVFPDAICPYTPWPGNDTVCPGLTDAARASNPLKATVNGLKEYFDVQDIKAALFREKRALGFSTTMAEITRYIPCVGELTKDPRCDVASPLCTLCPPGIPTTCCVTTTGGEDYNMDGEFTSHYGMEAEGGHAMTIVGYNDEYTTKDGYTGGYILKNSWWDGVDPPLGPVHARGSHSIRYFLQEISEFEERFNCPNSANPANWYQCQGRVGVIHADADAGVIRAPINASLVAFDECLSEDTRRDAASSFSPLHLSCTNDALCKANATYFVRNSTAVGDGFQTFCFFEYVRDGNSSDVCLPAMLPTDLAHAFAPIEAEAYVNNPDVCGFYFYPYAKQRAGAALGWEVSADDLDVTWAPQSYAANAHKFPTLDYTLVRQSTKVQKTAPVLGPIPVYVARDEL
ncbi:hypothetical protein SDRG_12479 [Saprolegnia diclina VS20]|uniref:Peptidase C1A papain C-terminal domain-containing protein n=1 Tax=Saprolegnia diclina (strain VS20) TaxID=1156394 RepID=T0PWQ9_SAPDV|nr:hypothetical protein SDRG_12479 [Saprolegnia diclina VS20]EQC29934.1 hypothetical protein SDRG_12479 [Saprolegnia diclina VS20]|eukprot:XP_008616773.1 hypothetical protein SDRG_12479 [Saprolegnia diclina VS20]